MQKQILLVDDELDILEELAELLTDEGYRVHLASGFNEALALFRATPGISLLVTDMKMPGRSGLDLIKVLQAEFPEALRYILLTGHAKSEVEDDTYRVQRKPLSIDEFLNEVGSLLSHPQ